MHGKPSKNATVIKIAEVMHKYDQIIVNRLNKAGARIDRHPGFLFRMGHDKEKLVDFDAWKKDTKSLLDRKAMERDLEMDYDTFLRDIFDDLRTGSYIRAQGIDESNVPLGFLSSTANTARKVSMQNRLKFKNGKSHFDYLKKYGNEHVQVIDSVIYAFEHSSRNTALMETFGPNPRNLIQKVLAEKHREFRKLSTKVTNQFVVGEKTGGLPRAIDAVLKDLDGSARVPANEMYAQFFRNARIIMNQSLLGNILVKSINDFASMLSVSRYAGQPFGDFIDAKANSLMSFLSSKTEAREFAKLYGIGQESLTGDLISMTGTNDLFHGFWSKFQRHFFKWTGIARWNDSLKSAYAMSLAGHLGNMSKIKKAPKNKEKLEQWTRFKKMLEDFDIDDTDWATLQRTVWSDKEIPGIKSKGRSFMTPDRIKELNDEVVAAYLRRKGVMGKDIKPITAYSLELDAVEKRLSDWKHRIRKEKSQAVKDLDDEIDILESSKAEHQEPLNEARQRLKRVEDQIKHNKKLEDKHSIHSKEYAKQAYDIDKQELRALKIEITRREAALEKISDKIKDKNEQIKTELAIREDQITSTVSAETAPEFRTMQKGGGKVGIQEVEGFTRKQLDDAREQLAQKVSVLIQTNNDAAVIIPGARERTAFHRGFQPGSAGGEIGRQIGQFKTFPTSVYTMHLERIMMAGGSKTAFEGLKKIGRAGGADLPAAAAFIATMIGYGALGLAITDKVTLGRTQRDWSDWHSWMRAAVSGGALGLYTDYIIAPYAQEETFKVWRGFAGPVANQFADTVDLFFAATKGDPAAQKLVNVIHNVTPYASMFYLRRIFDYLIWYNLKEMIDPGSLGKMEKRLRDRTGQEMTGGIVPGLQEKPSSVIAHGGGFR